MGLIDFFRKRKEKSIERAFAKIERELAEGAGEVRSPGHTAVDRCEHMIELAKEMDDEKREYQIVTSYLNDVERLQNLPEEEAKKLKETADNVSKLMQKREHYLNREKKISDADYSMIEREEKTLPDTINRFLENESYLDAISRDMRYLEGEKAQWEMLSEDYRGAVRRFRVLVTAMFVTVAVGTAIMLVLALNTRVKVMNVWIPLAAVLALAAGLLYLKSMSDSREIRQAEVNKNRAIELLNKAKIRYVNTKNAVDYCCEKYHVTSAKNLEKLYELYQEAARERAKYSENNEDLNYFSEKLMKLLKPYRLYDDRIWLSQAEALSNPKEMVEVKHNLIVRRQKLREQLELHRDEILSERREVEAYLKTEPPEAGEIEGVLMTIDRVTGLEAE